MKTNILTAIILILLVPGIVQAQITITGIVTDSISNKPIPDVNLMIKGSTIGTTTNQDGKFSLTVKTFPVTIVVSEIRHHSAELLVKKQSVTIRLSPKIQSLRPVTVQAKRIKSIHPDQGVYAYDFEFYDDYILVLAFRKSKKESQLFVLGDDGEVILSKHLSVTPEGFYRDRLGYVYLITADSAYQLFYDCKEMSLLYPTARNSFLSMMYPIKARYHGNLIMNTSSYRGLNSNYFVIGQNSRRQFYSISDSTKQSYLTREYDLRYFLKLRKAEVEEFQVSVKTLRENLDFYRQYIPLDWMDRQILAPVDAPLFKINDTIYIFDFTHSEVVRFDDQLNTAAKIPISFHKEKKWQKELIIDETWQDVYTCYLKDGITQITRLDPSTFKPKDSFRIDDMIFINKLKIRNGFAYFLYKDYCRDTKRMIYKMML